MRERNRVLIFLVVFIILTIILAYGSSVSLSQSEAQSLSQGVQAIPQTTLGIFRNNVQIALIEFIPGFGPAYGAYITNTTGVVLAAISQANPTARISGLESLVILMLTPIFWLEFFCYSLAIEESIAIIISFVKRDFLTREWKWLVGSVLTVVVVLFVSARLEVTLINFLK